MNRCPTFLKSSLLTLTLLAATLLAPLTAQGQVRSFPPSALRGLLEVTAPPQVLLNGEPARLSPGARIKGPNNLIVLSGTLVGQRILVNYVRDSLGLLHEVWLLTPAEAQEKRAGLKTISNIRFESDADPSSITAPADSPVR